MTSAAGCSIVIATRNRREALHRTLRRLRRDHPQVPIVVVDNASHDGTAAATRAAFTDVTVVALDSNRGAAARNVGVAAAATPYVALNDDDTFWEAGSLERACALFEAFPSVAALCATVRVLPGARIDGACTRMARSRLSKSTACPGTSIASFLAGATVLRRDAFLGAGGFHPRFFIGAEEALLAIDLMSAGWELIYDDRLLVYHEPCAVARDADARRKLVTRNRLWTAWLRRSLPSAARYTAGVAIAALRDAAVRSGATEALRGLPWIVRERRRMPRTIERRYAVVHEG